MNDIVYGVWIPGQGWLRIGSAIFADTHKEIAEEVAKYYGHNASVRFVDESITKLEEAYLQHEKESIWRILTSFKISKK